MRNVHTLGEPTIDDWDVIIERARVGQHAADKLSRTVAMLASALQRSRLRGDVAQVTVLAERLTRVYQLLDYA